MLHGYQRDYRLLHADAPNALDSGYLVLTALDGTVSPMREQVAQLVNVDGGGQAARIMVVASSPPGSPATAALSSRLRHSLPALAAATGGDVEIGQGAQYLLDYKNANTARVPWLVLALAIVAILTLIVVLRALLLPLIAVALNLATIAVALGALELLTEEHVLGGPGYIDAASGAGILSIMFVLSIDYEVFLLTRMREQWIAKGDAEEAIRYGLRYTASVISGLRGDHDRRVPRVRRSRRHPTTPVRRGAHDRGGARRDDRQARAAARDHARGGTTHLVDADLARAQDPRGGLSARRRGSAWRIAYELDVSCLLKTCYFLGERIWSEQRTTRFSWRLIARSTDWRSSRLLRPRTTWREY